MTSTRDPGCSPHGAAGPGPVPASDGVGGVLVERREHRTRVVLRGEVDVDLAPALDEAAEVARAAAVPVEVDASRVTFMDSTGVAFLARLAARAEPRVVLVRPTAVVQFVLEVTAVSSLLDVEAGGPEAGTGTGTQAGTEQA